MKKISEKLLSSMLMLSMVFIMALSVQLSAGAESTDVVLDISVAQ